MIITGFVHGLSNLGGSLLTSIVFSKKLSKNETRSTIVVCYLTFALIQLTTILLFSEEYYFKNTFAYCILSLFIVLLVEKYLYKNISSRFYNKIFELFLILMGIFLILK